MAATPIDGADSFQAAMHYARFGHRDWIWWHDENGSHAAVLTAESLKAALLAVGTKGKWSLIGADNGVPSKGFWWLGINILAQFKRGYR